MNFYKEPPASDNVVRIGFEGMEETTYFMYQLGAYANNAIKSEGESSHSNRLAMAALHLQAQIFSRTIEFGPRNGPLEEAILEVEIDNPITGEVANRAALITGEELNELAASQPETWEGERLPVPEDIHDLLEFVRFTHEVRKIKRAMWVKDEEQFENDSEHSYQLAMVALYIIDRNKLKMDVYEAMALALVHDVIEVYAGDTPVRGPEEGISLKAEREEQAVQQLKKQWPQFPLLHRLIAEYEARLTLESKFIYALDKLLPMLNNYADDGRNWRRMGVTIDDVIAVKIGKVDIDPTINSYNEAALTLIRQTPDLFNDVAE